MYANKYVLNYVEALYFVGEQSLYIVFTFNQYWYSQTVSTIIATILQGAGFRKHPEAWLPN